MSLRTSSTAIALLLLPLAAAGVSAETIYFKNRRTIEATGYEVKGPLIYVTMTNGRTVYLRADSVDWEGTSRLKSGGLVLEKTAYPASEAPSEQTGETAGSGPAGHRITASDLKKGLIPKTRHASAGITVEVPANRGWVDSGINVKAGQALGLRVSGRVVIGPGSQVGPQGTASPGTTATPLVQDKPYGALLVRVGIGGAPAVVPGRLIASADGRLYFAVNDRTPDDNSGEFSVAVDVSSGAGRASGTLSSSSAPSRSSASPQATAPEAPRKGMTGGVDRARSARDAAQSRGGATGE